MSSGRHQTQTDIDITSLPSVVKRASVPLLLLAAIVGGATYATLLMVPSHYASQTQIRVGRAGLAASGEGSGASAGITALKLDREAVASRVQELRSPDLARKLAAELRLNLRPEFNSILDQGGMLGSLMRVAGLDGTRPGETEEERVLAAYYRALQVYQVKDTRVINLSFTARDGELAARAANRLVELYQQWLRQQGVSETTDANAWLAPEIEKRTRELATAEAAVEQFRTTANLFRGSGGAQTGLAEQQLTDLVSELTKARGQRSEAEARAQTARELMNSANPDAIPDVQKSPVIQGLIAQRVRAERDRAEAATQLLPAHPRMRQLNANVVDIRRQVQREARTIVQGLEREVKVVGLREELAQRALDEAKGRVGNKAGDRVRLAQLEDEVKAKRQELATLRNRFEASKSRGSTKSVPVEIQVIATASPSSRPAWPNRGQIAALTATATFVLGLVFVLFRELLRSGARQPLRHPETLPANHPHEALQPTLDLPPAAVPRPQAAPAPVASGVATMTAVATAGAAAHAATAAAKTQAVIMPAGRVPPVDAVTEVLSRSAPVPDIERDEEGTSEPDVDEGAPVMPSVTAVVHRLLGNSAGQSGYRTVVVGASKDIDARAQAADIAASLSESGRQVMLVDWSQEGRGIAEALGLAASPGFTELLAGEVAFDDVIRVLPEGDVHVLPCGKARPGGSSALDPDRLNLLLDALDEAYADVVVTGSHSDIRDLFLAIEGRFDAAVLVEASGVDNDRSPQKFMDFEVSDIDVIWLDEVSSDLLGSEAATHGSHSYPSRTLSPTS